MQTSVAGSPADDGWEDYMGLAHRLAARVSRTSGDFDELRQVALIALWKAWQRFDPDRGAEFTSFAYRTITGELKRYRRDTGWMIRPPRPAHDDMFLLTSVVDELTHELSRSPTIAEMAERAGLSEEDAIIALEAGTRGHTSSLEDLQAVVGDSHPALGGNDPTFERSVVRDDLGQALKILGARDRRVVELRFFAELTQREIAAQVGLSQMQVSRVLRAALTKLRRATSLTNHADASLGAGDGTGDGAP